MTSTPTLFATPQGTKQYKEKFANQVSEDFFNISNTGLTLSSIGIGTYKGETSDRGDNLWREAIIYGLKHGINVIDTAIRYRSMRSEKLIGNILQELITTEELDRKQIFISTKGGLIAIPEDTDRETYIQTHIIKKRNIQADKIYNNMHCLDPIFIEGEIEKSLTNLQIQCIDCYFLHNPELTCLIQPKQDFYKSLYPLFELLEKKVLNKQINSYGIATWNGFRRRPGNLFYLDIEKIVNIAQQVAGIEHHLKYLEIPLSIGMPFIYNNHIPSDNNTTIPFLTKARQLKLNIFTSASLYEGHLEKLLNLTRYIKSAGIEDSPINNQDANISFPKSENSIIQLFELLIALKNHNIDIENSLHMLGNPKFGLYPNALQIVRSTPEVLTALAGMERLEYIKNNLKIAKIKKSELQKAQDFWKALSIQTDL